MKDMVEENQIFGVFRAYTNPASQKPIEDKYDEGKVRNTEEM